MWFSVTERIKQVLIRPLWDMGCRLADLQDMPMLAPSLVIMDAEGAEEELLDPAKVPASRHAHIVVEVHDFTGSGLGAGLVARFAGSHAITEITTRIRRLEDFEHPRSIWLRRYLLPSLQAFASECRPGLMQWLVMEPCAAN